MIIVKLMGGLGNQMFQYAAAKALALKHDVELLVDTGFLNADPNGAYTKRDLELSVFSMPLKFAHALDLDIYTSKDTLWKRVLRRWMPSLFKGYYFSERSQSLQDEFFTLPAHTYLDGFWQNEAYFLSVREQLIKDFRPKEKMPAVVAGYYARITNNLSVSLHIRRGDYVSVPAAGEFHGIAGLDYYAAALSMLKDKIGTFNLFVFSDDIDWCKNNLKYDATITYVEHAEHAVWDLVLMSLCNHNIIANSSFSWWGAWLNVNPNKIVILPKQWFRHLSSEEAGIKPDSWLCL